MSFRSTDVLGHILDEIEYLLEASASLCRERFLGDETLRRAFVRSLTIIGEATKKLPAEVTEAHPDIEWRAMAGMRDRLIHDYFGVDYELVWEVVASKIPDLRPRIQALIAAQGDAGPSGSNR